MAYACAVMGFFHHGAGGRRRAQCHFLCHLRAVDERPIGVPVCAKFADGERLLRRKSCHLELGTISPGKIVGNFYGGITTAFLIGTDSDPVAFIIAGVMLASLIALLALALARLGTG